MKTVILLYLIFGNSLFANKSTKSNSNFVLKLEAPPRPIGTMSFKVNGVLFTADNTTVTCTYVGTQAVIVGSKGGDKMVFSYFAKAITGKVAEINDTVYGGFSFKKAENEYTNNPTFKPGKMHINITKTKAIGRYTVAAGIFEGELFDKAGNKVLITDGKFESGHL